MQATSRSGAVRNTCNVAPSPVLGSVTFTIFPHSSFGLLAERIFDFSFELTFVCSTDTPEATVSNFLDHVARPYYYPARDLYQFAVIAILELYSGVVLGKDSGCCAHSRDHFPWILLRFAELQPSRDPHASSSSPSIPTIHNFRVSTIVLFPSSISTQLTVCHTEPCAFSHG